MPMRLANVVQRAWHRTRHVRWIVVPTWFVTISGMRLSVLISTPPGYDGMLYRDATLRWLSGGDPWAIQPGQALFAGPPPTLLAMVPFATLPEAAARLTLVALGVAASIWMIRRLRLPIWWLAFPPLVDGLYIANPHVFIVPLILAGPVPLAVVVKLYAALVPAVRGQVVSVAIALGIVLLTAPILPWTIFLSHWPEIGAALASQSGGGGLSVLATPLVLPIAIVAAVIIGRERLAWWSVPVFWPYTQWYYSSLALPGLASTPLAAMALCVPIPGAPAIAIAIAGAELVGRARRADPLRPQPVSEPDAILGS
jgi:hypothetical protein